MRGTRSAIFLKQQRSFSLQVMGELDLDDFQHGGVNITGFRLSSSKFQDMQRVWNKLNPNYWKGAGPGNKIKVRQIDNIVDLLSVVLLSQSAHA